MNRTSDLGRSAVLSIWTGVAWQHTSEKRFRGDVARVALHLRRVGRVAPGDCVAVVAPVSAESLVVERAALTQGAAVVAIDPDLDRDALRAAWARFVPRMAFVVRGAMERVRALRTATALVAFDTPSPEGRIRIRLPGGLDPGGAVPARRAPPDAPAIACFDRDGASRWLTRAELALRALRNGPLRGDLALVVARVPSLDARAAIQAFVADGRTRIALGATARADEDVQDLRPRWIIAQDGVVERLAARAEHRARAWLFAATRPRG
jgi:hypothetical protein